MPPCTHCLGAGVCGGRKSVWNLLGWEAQMVVNCLVWVLGAELSLGIQGLY